MSNNEQTANTSFSDGGTSISDNDSVSKMIINSLNINGESQINSKIIKHTCNISSYKLVELENDLETAENEVNPKKRELSTDSKRSKKSSELNATYKTRNSSNNSNDCNTYEYSSIRKDSYKEVAGSNPNSKDVKLFKTSVDIKDFNREVKERKKTTDTSMSKEEANGKYEALE